MHLTSQQQTTRPPGVNSLQQQARFDAFVNEFNTERPHEAIAMRCPAELYTASPRAYDGLPELEYPFHDRDILVTACGRICLQRKKINVSTVLAGQKLGIKEVDDGIWLVSFMHYDLGYIDLEQRTLQTIDNPFGTRLSPMS
jgi:hypothetical protein